MPCNSLPKSWLAESRRRIGSYLETMTNSSYEWHLNSFVCDTNQQIGFHNKANQWCRWGTWWTGCRQPVNNHPSRCGWVGLEGEKGEGLFTYIHMATSRSTPPRAWGPSPRSLSITPSGVPLLAIISAVRSRAAPPPRHISLCQLTPAPADGAAEREAACYRYHYFWWHVAVLARDSIT